MKPKEVLLLLLLTVAALFVHGYHPFAEDSETYLPGVEHLLRPELFPVGRPYFLLHAHLTLFPDLLAASVRLTHLPLPWVLFLWHVLSIFLFLLACLRLMERAFTEPRARWCGVALVATLLTLPVAGSALYIMDEYINPRNLTAFAVVFAVVRVLDRRYLAAALFLLFAAAIHPFMTVYAASFCLLLAVLQRGAASGFSRAAYALIPMPFTHLFDRPSPAYELVAQGHRYQFLLKWHWYEVLGALAPLAILFWFARLGRRLELRALKLTARALVIYGAFYFLAGLLVSSSERWAVLARLQPMRSLYLLYVLFVLFAGGFFGQFVLRARAWLWIALFAPLATGMFAAQRSLFPASAQVEWPWVAPRNPWAQAFVWVRENTPVHAIFAIDPYYMSVEGEDAIGFRALAERSQLADGGKDGGVVEMFPQIGDRWLAEVKAHTGMDSFSLGELQHLESTYGVNWVVLHRGRISGSDDGGRQESDQQALDCPYQNQVVKVCRLP